MVILISLTVQSKLVVYLMPIVVISYAKFFIMIVFIDETKMRWIFNALQMRIIIMLDMGFLEETR